MRYRLQSVLNWHYPPYILHTMYIELLEILQGSIQCIPLQYTYCEHQCSELYSAIVVHCVVLYTVVYTLKCTLLQCNVMCILLCFTLQCILLWYTVYTTAVQYTPALWNVSPPTSLKCTARPHQGNDSVGLSLPKYGANRKHTTQCCR